MTNILEGIYTSRALSFDGVEYDILEHRLTPPQVHIYDTYCDAWEIIHQMLNCPFLKLGEPRS